MTSYDVLYTYFLQNCKADDIDLPSTDQEKYDFIHNAVLHFNNRLRDTLKYDDTLEQFDRELDGDSLLILAHYLRLSFLKNQLTYFSNVWQPFQKDIGIQSFATQMRILKELVADEEKIIEDLILYKEEDFI